MVVLSWALLAGCAGEPARARSPSTPSPSSDTGEAEARLRQALEAEKQSRWDDALRNGAEAARLLEPLRDSRLGTAYQVVGRAELEMKRCDLASEAYQRAVRARAAAFGAEHRLVAISLASLAEARRCAGDLSSTVALFERAYRIFAREPATLPERVDVASRLGALYNRRGEAARAAALLRETLDAVRAAQGAGSALEWLLIGPLDASLRALGDQAGVAALYAGLPASDYCLPEPCPASAPGNPSAASVAPQATPREIEDAAAVVGALRGPFRGCYHDALRRDRRAVGQLKVSIDVGPEGAPWKVTARALGFLDAEAVHCVLSIALQAQFVAPSGGKAMVQVPITFVRQD